MLCRTGPTPFKHMELLRTTNVLIVTQRRLQSSYTVVRQRAVAKDKSFATEAQLTGLERLPTKSILRSLTLGALFTTPYLFKPGFSVLRKVADSTSVFLNPDANPLLRAIIKPLIYDAFCAGRTKNEIYRTRDTIKRMGYSGVILCYGRENVIEALNNLAPDGNNHAASDDVEIEQWRNGNLDTLDMIGEGDWLGIKYA